MATTTLSISNGVKLLVETKVSLTGNYPDIKASVAYNFKIKTLVTASCYWNGYKFVFDGMAHTANVNFSFGSSGGTTGVLASGTKTYSLGTAKKISKTIKASCSGLWACSGNVSFTSPTISAPTNYGLSVSSITEKSVKITHTLTNVRCYWRVRLKDKNSGKTWTLSSNTGNGSTTISGLTPNTSYSFVVEVLDRSGAVCYTSAAKSAKTLGISKVGNSPSFTLGSSFTLTITGYSDSFTHNVTFTVGTYSFSRTGLKRGNLTINPTSAEVDAMYNQFTTAADKTMSITLTTLVSGSSIGSSSGSGTVKINVSVAKPVVNSFSYEDTIASAFNITGNKTHLIQNVSKIKVSGINATAQKGAAVKSYQLIVGSRTTASTSTTITDTAVITANSGVTVKVIDSRGLEGTKTISFAKYYAYVAPKLSTLSPRRRNSIEDAIYLKMNGSFIPLTVNGVKKNNSCTVSWCYKKSSESTYGSYATIKSFTDGSISFDSIIGNLDSEYSFNIRVRLADSLTTTTWDCVISRGTPDLSVGRSKVAVGKVAETPNLLDSAWDIRVTKSPQASVRAINGNGDIGILSSGANCGLYNYTKQYWPILNNGTDDTRIGVVGGQYLTIHFDGNYIGFDGTSGGYIRTPSSGLLPNKSGGSGTIGSSSWPFNTAYVNKIYAKTAFYLPNGKSFYGTSSAGVDCEMLSLSSGDNVSIGYGGPGSTNIYARSGHVNLIPKGSGGYVYIYRYGNTSGAALCLGTSYSSSDYVRICSYWKDGNIHEIITKAEDGLSTAIGWVGSSTYATNTKMRGRTCQYQNASGTTSLSDRNLKRDIVDLSDEKYDVFFDNLKPREYKFILGSSGRPHFGYITQEVEEALSKAGLTTKDFAGVNIVKIHGREQETDENGNKIDIVDSPDNYLLDKNIHEQHNLIYTEFIALNTMQIQKLKTEVERLKEQIKNGL